MRRIFFLLAVWAGGLLSAAAQSAYSQYIEAAKQGDAAAQNEIGLCYDTGNGVQQDLQQAFLWYSKAAAQNLAIAQYNVGCCYCYGKGVQLDYAQAITWFRKAADQNFVQAQYNLGCCFMNGQGVQQNHTMALYWFKKAAEQNLPIAAYNVGFYYYHGYGVEKDFEKAVSYYQKAADLGHAPAFNNLGVCYKTGIGVPKDLTKAFEMYQMGADLGDEVAQDNLAICYAQGEGVQQDFEKAIYWLEKSLAAGYQPARDHLANVRAAQRNQQATAANQPQNATSQQVAPKAEQTKFEKNIEAARQGNIAAQNAIGVCYYNGDGVEQDYKKAAEWFWKTAEKGNVTGQYNLGYMYDYGKGFEQDHQQALYWYQKAAGQGHKNSMNNLGVMYEFGRGVQKDYAQAAAWYKQAADKGDKKAQDNLQKLQKKQEAEQMNALAAVDKDIPATDEVNSNTFVVIIGNEKYDNEADVPYAENDAHIFRQYVQKTLGVPEKQIQYTVNATLNNIRRSVRWLSQAMEVCQGSGRIIFYYAGHGIPDESSRSAYLLPIDGLGSDVETAYSLKSLYEEFGKMKAERVTVFLDACFSGSKREEGMLASARSVAIKAKPQAPADNMVVFTAAQGDETAYPYKEMRHGMFTYYLLKKLQDTKGATTLGELEDYLTKEVKRQSFVENDKMQTPSVNASAALQSKWKNMTLK